MARAEAAIHVGCGWLLREIELANLKGKDLTLQPGAGCGKATVFIEASKTDTEARGCHRSLECWCPAPACPVGAAKALWHGKRAHEFVVTGHNQTQLAKEDTVQAIRGYGEHLGMASTTDLSGHSMRANRSTKDGKSGPNTRTNQDFWPLGEQQTDGQIRTRRFSKPIGNIVCSPLLRTIFHVLMHSFVTVSIFDEPAAEKMGSAPLAVR